jgi:GNAT superfamily N-acetyltransferase
VSTPVVYGVEPALGPEEFRRVLVDSGLGAIRPVDDLSRLRAMLSAAQLVVTARRDRPDGPLLGVARTITDFAWCAYLSDLAVARSAQGLGIGKGLLDATRAELGPQVALILSSVPEAVRFYERVQMERIADAFWYRRAR